MFPNKMADLTDFQAFHRWLDVQKGFNDDLPYTMVLLTGEVGEVARVIKQIVWKSSLNVGIPEEARAAAVAEYRADLGEELADCLAYLLKLANNTGIDLHEAYLAKMAKNLNRTWTAPEPPAGADT